MSERKKTAKVFNNTEKLAEQTTQHMKTAQGMIQRDGLGAAVGYLQSCGWHHETAERFLKPNLR